MTATRTSEFIDLDAAKRLNAFIKTHIHKTNRQAAVILEVNESALWKMINGQRKINSAVIKKLLRDYNLNIEWLYSGNGKAILNDLPKEVITDMKQLNGDMTLLEKQLETLKLTMEDLMKRIDQQDAEIARLRKELSQLN